MNELAPAKVNLCLFLGPVRKDGRHELVTVLESVSLCDELSLEVLPEGSDEVVCEGVKGANLVSAALDGLRARGWRGPPVRIEIRKRIPVAAGRGGGAADAAAALRLAQRLAPVPGLGALAAELGADVPSQLEPGLALGTGAGELIEPLPMLEPHALVIVPQPVALSTAEVDREADRLGLPRPSLDGLRERLLGAGAKLPAELLVNELEPATVSLCPDVGRELQALREAGADHALVCGSGPTVAGLCWGEDAIDRVRTISTQLGGSATPVVPVSSPGFGTIDRDR